MVNQKLHLFYPGMVTHLFDHGIGDVEDDGVVERLDDLFDLPLLRPHVAQQMSWDVASLGYLDALHRKLEMLAERQKVDAVKFMSNNSYILPTKDFLSQISVLYLNDHLTVDFVDYINIIEWCFHVVVEPQINQRTFLDALTCDIGNFTRLCHKD